MTFKPMLASPADLGNIRFPIFASPKLDGIRASVVSGKLLSRSLKEIPSRHIFNQLSRSLFEGLDGELIVGEPTADDCYRNTVSHVMADNKVFDFTYHVFDLWDSVYAFEHRRKDLTDRVNGLSPQTTIDIRRVKHIELFDYEQLEKFEAECVVAGYEGVMLADPKGRYKFGRATTKGGELLKVKRFMDSEAEIVGIQEEMFNGNAAETNELGRTKRSSAKAGKIGKGTMGALVVRDIHSGVEFNIGTGFTAAQRAADWTIGSIHKYKFFPVGVKDAPRHPVYLGPRSKIDL